MMLCHERPYFLTDAAAVSTMVISRSRHEEAYERCEPYSQALAGRKGNLENRDDHSSLSRFSRTASSFDTSSGEMRVKAIPNVLPSIQRTAASSIRSGQSIPGT